MIANWATVLSSDIYWQNWRFERETAYGKSITDGHIATARQKLNEWLITELANASQGNSKERITHLEALFHLENGAITILKQTESSPSFKKSGKELRRGSFLAK